MPSLDAWPLAPPLPLRAGSDFEGISPSRLGLMHNASRGTEGDFRVREALFSDTRSPWVLDNAQAIVCDSDEIAGEKLAAPRVVDTEAAKRLPWCDLCAITSKAS